MRALSSLPPGRLAGWSRYVLVTCASLVFAGITTKIIVSGSTPFGWSSHWSVHETFGHALRVLAYGMWLPALLGRLGRRSVVATVLLALAFPIGEQTLSPVSAVTLIALPCWIALRTLDHLRPASGPPALSVMTQHPPG